MAVAGFIGRVLSAVRSSDNGPPRVLVKIGRWGAVDSPEFEMVSAPGDDAPPLPADFAGAFAVERSAGFVAGGFTDSKNAGIAANGEKRIYGRDSDGAVRCAVYLQADGSVEISNSSGTVTLKPDGSVDANGATISPQGAVTTANLVDVDNHMHLAGSLVAPPGGGPVTGTTGAPIPG